MKPKNKKMPPSNSATAAPYCSLATSAPDVLPDWAGLNCDLVLMHPSGFHFQTDADFDNGLSYLATPNSDLDSTRYILALGPLFGQLEVVIIKGVKWCTLDSAARFVGVPISQLTGANPDEGFCVRGKPGKLFPDGIRSLRPQGFDSNGIRLESLVPHVTAHLANDPRALTMLLSAISYLQNSEKPESGGHVDIWKIYEKSTAACIPLTAFHSHWHGRFRILRIGLTTWFDIQDICRATGISLDDLEKIAKPSRVIHIPNADVACLGNSGARGYIRADVCRKIVSAMQAGEHDFPGFPLGDTEIWSPRELLEIDSTVRASTLYKFLGDNLPFADWVATLRSNVPILDDLWSAENDAGRGMDIDIPAYLARSVCAEADSIRADLAHILLSGGGYRYGGPAGETAEETLVRFCGLLPDKRGRIRVRQIWELAKCPGNFAKWVHRHLFAPGKRIPKKVPLTSDLTEVLASIVWEEKSTLPRN